MKQQPGLVVLWISALLSQTTWPAAAEVDLRLVSGLAFHPGDAANGRCHLRYQTADGRYVLFQTVANNLEPGIFDANDDMDVYLLDRESGAFDLISRTAEASSHAPDGYYTSSNAIAVSDDGRWVVFQSEAKKALVGGVTYPGSVSSNSVFLFDRTSRTMQLVSHLPGDPATAMSGAGATDISADGRFVLFFDSGPYLFDRTTGEVQRVLHPPGSPGQPASGGGSARDLSADGNFVLLESSAVDLVPGQIDGPPSNRDVFLYDRPNDVFELVSRSFANPLQAVGGTAKAMSNDGRYLLFDHAGVAVIAGLADGNGSGTDVFLFDRQSGTMRLASPSATVANTSGNGRSRGFAVSDDGRYVYLTSSAGDLLASFVDNNGAGEDVYVFDQQANTVALVSHAAGSSTQGASANTSFNDFTRGASADGRYALYSTQATNLQAGVTDTNGSSDYYLFDRFAAASSLVSRIGGSLSAGGAHGPPGLVASDGATVFASSGALDPQVGDTFGDLDLFRFDPAASTLGLLSAAGPGGRTTLPVPATEYSYATHLATNGRWVVWHDFLWDALTGTLERMHHPAGDTASPAAGKVDSAVVAPDGRYVTFSSDATGLQVGITDTNSAPDVFLYDRQVDAAVLISHLHGSPTVAAQGYSAIAWQSDDVQLFALDSRADDLVAGMPPDPSNTVNVYLYDRPTQSAELVSHAFSSTVESAGLDSAFLDISADRRYVFYQSAGFRQVENFVDHNDYFVFMEKGGHWVRVPDLYLRDRQNHTAQLISRRAGTTAEGSAGTPENARATADFSSIFFHSAGDDLVAGQVALPGKVKVFRWNRATGTSELVIPAPGNPVQPCSGSMYFGDASSDGRWVLVSGTCQLVPGDVNARADTYLLDRQSSAITLISHQNGDPSLPLGIDTVGKHVSDDGRLVLYSGETSSPEVAGVPYAYDRGTGKATLLAFAWDDPQKAVKADFAAVSADSGRFLLSTVESDLAPFDANARLDYFHVTLGELFADGFESGNTEAWSLTLP